MGHGPGGKETQTICLQASDMNPVSRSACVARWAHERPEERFAGQAKSKVRKVSWLDQDWRQVEDLAFSCRALGSTVPGFLVSC